MAYATYPYWTWPMLLIRTGRGALRQSLQLRSYPAVSVPVRPGAVHPQLDRQREAKKMGEKNLRGSSQDRGRQSQAPAVRGLTHQPSTPLRGPS